MSGYDAYRVSGPRYTSYPTADRFTDAVGAVEWVRAALASNSDLIPRPLSLYLHVPFCDSPCFFCACTKVITRDPAKIEVYAGALLREIGMQAALFHGDRVVHQLHFGGGTPSTLGAAGLSRVMEALHANYTLSGDEDREFGIELDPRHADTGLLGLLVDLGFNRVSLGIQDFDPAVQQAVNRIQSVDATLDLIRDARDRGFRGINVDLICGLPKQTVAGFTATLDRVVGARPDRVALYGYAHLPARFVPQRQIYEPDLPVLDAKLALLRLADERLLDAGYVEIGMDHYALPGDSLAEAFRDGTLQRNFQGYSTHADCDLVGHGMSAISMVGECYVQNRRKLPDYNAAIARGELPVARGITLTRDDRIRRNLILGFMCTGRVDFDKLGARYDIDCSEYFAGELDTVAGFARDGLIAVDGHGIKLLPAGRPVMRIVAMAFDANLADSGHRFSNVI